jgi:hypothetical protein
MALQFANDIIQPSSSHVKSQTFQFRYPESRCFQESFYKFPDAGNPPTKLESAGYFFGGFVVAIFTVYGKVL